MGDYLKIDASLVSYVGITDSAGTGSYYINGKYTCRPPISNMSISVESIRDTQLFAVSEGMENDNTDRNAPVSLVENIHRYYQKNADNVENIEEALDGLYDVVEDTFNKIGDQAKADDYTAEEPALAGILLHENSAGIISIGGTRVYLVRNGSLKLLAEDSKKTDKALKIEDFADEQEDEISIDGNNVEEDTEIPRKGNVFEVRAGDVFLLSSNSLIDYLDEEALLYIMSLDGDSAYMSVTAMDEILKRQRKQDILLQVIKIEEIKGLREHRAISRLGQRFAARSAVAAAAFAAPAGESTAREFTGRMPSKSASRKIKRALKLIVSTIIIFAVVFGIFMGLQRLLFGPPENGGDKTKPVTTTAPATTAKPTTTSVPTTGGATTTAAPTTAAAPTTTVRSTTAASSTTAFTGNYQEYTVKKGDTLSSISRQFYGDTSKVSLIMEANNIKNADSIEIGMVLKIPALN